MEIMNTIKILIAPYVILLTLAIYKLTGEEVYLFIAGSLLLLFSGVFLSILLFVIFRFGSRSIIETEIQPLPWMLFFLGLLIYLFLKI